MRDIKASKALRQAVGRIAILSHTHPSISKGGAEIAAFSVYTGLQQLGIEAVFITACGMQDRDRLCLASDNEHAVFYDPANYDHFYHLGTPEVWSQLQRILLAQRINTINVHHYLYFGLNSMQALAAEGRWRTVVTLHEFLAICHHHGQMVTRPARLLCNVASAAACASCYPERSHQQFELRKNLFFDAIGRSAGFISPSHFLAGRFVDWGLPGRRMAVIENGLMGHTGRLATRSHQPGAPWVFGFFGQINPFKGVDTLLNAVEDLARTPKLAAQVRIRIHGNLVGQAAEFTERLNAMLSKYPILSYAGPYNNATVGRLMEACDYVLVPSTWWENSPVVIQEAYAAGRPVICSGIGGMAEKVVDGVSGLHFSVGDHADLIRVLAAAADPEVHARLSVGVPAVLDSKQMARQYLIAFRRFLASGPRAKPPVGEAIQSTETIAHAMAEAH